jgi:hypothetical protein
VNLAKYCLSASLLEHVTWHSLSSQAGLRWGYLIVHVMNGTRKASSVRWVVEHLARLSFGRTRFVKPAIRSDTDRCRHRRGRSVQSRVLRTPAGMPQGVWTATWHRPVRVPGTGEARRASRPTRSICFSHQPSHHLHQPTVNVDRASGVVFDRRVRQAPKSHAF